MKIALRFVQILIVFTLLVILLQNGGQQVSVKALTWESGLMPLPIVIFLALVAGAAIGAAIMAFTTIDARTEIRALRTKNGQLRTELEKLRNIAIEDIPESTVAAIGPPETSETAKSRGN